jgi:tetratricopeptide (TPR) repeat protein
VPVAGCLPETRLEIDMMRAGLAAAAGRRTEAGAAYERILGASWIQPKWRSRAAWELAALLFREGDLPGAHEVLGQMTAAPPSPPLYLQMERSYARLLVREREYEKAADLLKTLAGLEGLPASERVDLRAERISLQRKIRNRALRRDQAR